MGYPVILQNIYTKTNKKDIKVLENTTYLPLLLLDFLSKLDINPSDKNFGLLIRNLNAVTPELKKIDERREFFTLECQKQLNELSIKFIGPFKPMNKAVLGWHLHSLLVHISEDSMRGEVRYLTSLFIYSQLKKDLLTGHTASPLVKTNRMRLRIFIEQVNKKKISLNKSIETNDGIIDAKYLLADVISNDKIEEHRKTAILLKNIYKAIIGHHNFSVMNKKRNGPVEPKLTKRPYKKTVQSPNGGSKKPEADDISDIYSFSKTVYVEKPESLASAAINHVVYETTDTSLINRKEANRFTQIKSAIENNYPQNHRRVLKNIEAKEFYKELLLQFEQVETTEQKKAALGMIFILLLGLDDTWLSDILIVDEINDLSELNKRKILVSTKAFVQFQQIELPHAYTPIKKDLHFLLSQQNQIITLPLPNSLIPLLIEIKELMNTSEFNVNKDIYDAEFTKMRGKLKKRFTNDKLREFTFNQIVMKYSQHY